MTLVCRYFTGLEMKILIEEWGGKKSSTQIVWEAPLEGDVLHLASFSHLALVMHLLAYDSWRCRALYKSTLFWPRFCKLRLLNSRGSSQQVCDKPLVLSLVAPGHSAALLRASAAQPACCGSQPQPFSSSSSSIPLHCKDLNQTLFPPTNRRHLREQIGRLSISDDSNRWGRQVGLIQDRGAQR